jgi:SNF2 family DNA or RNA helicase
MQPRIVKDHIVFQTNALAKVKALFPDVKATVNDGITYCAVPHTLDVTRVFHNVGGKIESPIVQGYDWPGRFTPFPHQKDTAGFLTLNPRAFCLNGMGTMKTASTIWAADYLMKQGVINKCLISAPLSTLERVWGDELFCLLPHRGFAVLHGARDKRRRLLSEPHDFYVINHDGIGIVSDIMAQRNDIDHIVIDEVAVFRNARTNRWKIMNELLNKQHPRSVWGLTGTPTPNAPTDAFAQSKLLVPSTYPGHFTSFKHDTMLQVSQFRWVPKQGAEEKVNSVLKPSIRYALEDCVNLPPTIYQDRTCDLTTAQRKHMKDLMDEATTVVDNEQVTAVNAAALITKMVQAACGVMYSSSGAVVEIDFGPRLKLLKELIEECNEKVIVFVPLTGALEALKCELQNQWSVEVVDGSVSSTKRNKIFHDFQKERDPHILLANAGTMAHGLTLTAASTIIWYAPTNNNDTYNQANARIVRPGQTKTTNIINMYSTPVERKTYLALKEKTKLDM